MATKIQYTTTIVAPTGGVNSTAGIGMEYSFTLALTGGEAEVTLILTNTETGVTSQFGFGTVTGLDPIFSFTYGNKVYLLAGPTVYFSALNDPTTWNDPNGIFNGFVTMSNYYATQSPLTSMAVFQGKMAFFSNYTVQFWIIDPNPANWQQAQVLTNIGTNATFSVMSLGDLDVLFLSPTGIRSLRVRETTLNAYVNDLGSPVDSLVISDFVAGNPAASQGIVDPSTGRYWLFIPNTSAANGVGNIYILSYYPSNKIIAWSTYDPSWFNGVTNTFFTPIVFQVFQNQVYCRSVEGDLQLFGGVNNNTYDATEAIMQVPFFDMKAPSSLKKANAIDVDIRNGTWEITGTGDWITGDLAHIVTADQSTYDQGSVPFSADGTHFSIQASTVSASKAVFTTMSLDYNAVKTVQE